MVGSSGFLNQPDSWFAKGTPNKNQSLATSIQAQQKRRAFQREAGMTDRYRTQHPVGPEYLNALGQAMYSFSSLEWMVIWAAEQIEPGFINTDPHTMKASLISRQFREMLKRARHSMPEEVWNPLKDVSDRFWAAIDLRGALLHAHPLTGPGGEQMLGRRTEQKDLLHWDIGKIDAATRFIEEVGSDLNQIFHSHLYPTPSWRTSTTSLTNSSDQAALPAPSGQGELG